MASEGDGLKLEGAHILSAGTWNGVPLGEAELDGIVATFNAMNLSGRVPLKLGHDSAKPTDGEPALGWVTRVYRAGRDLLMDADIVESTARIIRENMYKFVSVELIRDVKADTRVIPWVLDAVALLGATQPAVGILKDLKDSLRMASGCGLRGTSAAVALKRESTVGGTIAIMTPEEIAALQAKLAAAEAESAALKLAREEDARKAREEKIKLSRTAYQNTWNDAITAKRVLPKHQTLFESLIDVKDDNTILALTAAGDTRLETFLSANEIKADPGKKEDMSTENDETGRTAAEVVTLRAQKQAVAMGFKANDTDALVSATKVVLRRDKDLATAYMSKPREVFTGKEA